ncbi:50S ribosomal protein L25/general stress protein Ctc [Propionibacterium australiense]|uniref:Large ribosomal subunit protein bL25 n=1 Tax=Propionibacterium australiense TaxID=119981 RepID=A0A383S847_9ACTN|nr:50S ribosomal protein L25/general stress protein Ctc [Propionibacterium australiense]RLP09531.1 50S ribosomal protein L25/general stress protein Ctc [Propionibacterium australiense]RLP09891.1 50S ribosomal protein L25/general stress protein Ctc [Propionibacterium australiense]SYZ34175.1 Ribosomal protein TL5, C-terminal domain [Propionibacterium australiense]VEH89407.1 General stress protein CTC [Propionibacterium australiense]
MAEIILNAEERTEFGKGAARRIRRADKVPAVLYGHGTEPVHLTLPGHETLLALRLENALLTVRLEGAEDRLALPKQVQRDPIKGFLKHVDLLLVKRGEKVTVEVPIEFVGTPASGGIVNEERTHLALQAEATNIPARVEVSVEGLEVGAQVTADEVALPVGAELEDPADTLILSVSAPAAEEEPEAAAEDEAEAAAESEAE